MSGFELSSKIGGAALVIGFLLILLLLFRDPTRVVPAATGGIQSLLFLLMFPIAGFVVGIYTYFDGPYNAGPVFLAASYLGVFGLTLIVGFPSSGIIGVFQVLGFVLFALSVVAILLSLQRLAEVLGLGSLLPSGSERSGR